MKHKKSWIQMSLALLLLLTLLLPVVSIALAEGEQAVEIPIEQETELWSTAGRLLGKLVPDGANGTELQLKTGETITGVIVRYVPYEANEQEKQVKALVAKTKVLLSLAQVEAMATDTAESAAETGSPDAAMAAEATPAPETTPETKKPDPTTPSPALPQEGWIDSNLVSIAIYANFEREASARVSAEAKLAEIERVTPEPSAPLAVATPEAEQAGHAGIFSQSSAAGWVPFAALALGIVGAGMLAWIAYSAFNASTEARHQTDQIKKITEGLAAGVAVKSPVKVELTAWPIEGRVEITSDALDQIAARPAPEPAKEKNQEEPPPPPKQVPPGEDPELLALCNSLAGVGSADKWHSIVKEAGWRAVLLQPNPTGKGTYIPDAGGYSVVACLMRGADADLAFVLPSYQDPNASEDRWSEFFEVNTDMAVRNYHVDALPEMFIERGTFFLQKSKGKLTRRPLYY